MPFLWMLSGTSVWLSGGVNSMTGPGSPKSAGRDGRKGRSAGDDVDALFALVVRDERDAQRSAGAQDDRRQVAAHACR